MRSLTTPHAIKDIVQHLQGRPAEQGGPIDISQSTVSAVIDSLGEVIKSALQEGTTVKINGIATFQVVGRDARLGRNPRTGEAVDVNAKNVCRIKAASVLTEAAAKAPLADAVVTEIDHEDEPVPADSDAAVAVAS